MRNVTYTLCKQVLAILSIFFYYTDADKDITYHHVLHDNKHDPGKEMIPCCGTPLCKLLPQLEQAPLKLKARNFWHLAPQSVR